MGKPVHRPTSAVPKRLGKPVDPQKSVNLLGMILLLKKHLTPVLCQSVFEHLKDKQRDRKWVFNAIVAFWVAMAVDNPRSLSQGVAQTRKRRHRQALWPHVGATAQAFFQKCQELRPDFFQALYRAFLSSLWPEIPEAYASWMKALHPHFPAILVVDGSRLDAVRHRLKLLWRVRAQVLPGCVTVFYDLYRGIAREVLFYPNAAEPELPRAQDMLDWIAQGTLLLGDRLYASVQYVHLLAGQGLYGLFRRNGRLKIRRLEVLSRKQGSRCLLEEFLVEVGCGATHPKITLRLIRCRGKGRSLDLLTNVLDPKRLSAQQAVQLYGLRWSIERMFLDLKETLNLHSLYASHPNLVAQQVYAAAIVHAAFRVAQAGIAAQARVLPEQLSSAKLFPQLADASKMYCVGQWTFLETRALNPGVRLKPPDFRKHPDAWTPLGSILLQHRRTRRRTRKFHLQRARWKSFAHVPGGPTLLKTATVG